MNEHAPLATRLQAAIMEIVQTGVCPTPLEPMTDSLGVRRAGGEPLAESEQPKPDAETATLNPWVQGPEASPVCLYFPC